ncbi:MAG TPA: histidine kinase [Actinocatenispora sp.]
MDGLRLLSDERSPLRLAVLPVAAAYLVLVVRGGAMPSGTDWALIVCSGVVALGGGRRPLAAVLGQCALLVVAERIDQPVAIGLKIMASVAVFELAARRGWRQTLAGALALAAVYGVYAVEQFPTGTLAWVYRAAAVVCAPALLGAVVRAGRLSARQARARAADAERRRELAERTARLAERTAIARELHDLVAHHVSSMVLRVGVARHIVTDPDPRLAEVLDDVHDSAATALTDLRRLVRVLRDETVLAEEPGPLLLSAGELAPALRNTVATSGLRVRTELAAAIDDLDALRRLVVLRLVQEGLANAARHAGPDTDVRLRVGLDGDGTVEVEIGDTGGRGTTAPGPGGYGLVGMRERVGLAGGTLSAGPDGTGWRLLARLPEPSGLAAAS